MVIIASDVEAIKELKDYSNVQFHMKDPNRDRRFVGKLIYLSIIRPNISSVVQFLSQFRSICIDAHMKEVYHLLRYLRATSYHGVMFSKDKDF